MIIEKNLDKTVKSLIEFCFDDKYYQFNENYSESYTNASPFQAWRAGFREGVKMGLDQGNSIPPQDIMSKVHQHNLKILSIWQSVGADVEYGLYAMLGARIGCYNVTLNKEYDIERTRELDYCMNSNTYVFQYHL